MRFVVVSLFALSALCANAQDASQMAAQPAMQANQQAMQAAQQANQQAMQAAQQATQQAMQANQQAMQAAQQANNYCCGSYFAAAPRFSKKTGSYRPGTTVRLKDSTRGAVMYYTTDGWTPTTRSHRYAGPIKLDSSTVLQAIAIAPGHLQSRVSVATYTILGAPQAALPSATIANLSPGTPLPFVFTSDVTSKGLEIGDRLPVALAKDLIVGGVLIAPKLTPVRVTVMQVDGPGAGGAPRNHYVRRSLHHADQRRDDPTLRNRNDRRTFADDSIPVNSDDSLGWTGRVVYPWQASCDSQGRRFHRLYRIQRCGAECE